MINFLIKKYNSKKAVLVDNICDTVSGICKDIKFYTKDNILSIELQNDTYYLMHDTDIGYLKVIYRNNNLFIQNLDGKKSNFFNISRNETIDILSEFTLSKDTLVFLGTGFSVKSV